MDKPPLQVVYRPEAREHLQSIEEYIADKSHPEIAANFVAGLQARCDLLGRIPYLGTARDDVRSGLRTVAHDKAATIAFTLEKDRVVILAVLYRGRSLNAYFR